MLRLAADENFNNNIVRGLLRRKPDLEIARLQDVGLSGADDPTVLDWAASEGRVLFSHDVSTLTRYAYERVEAGKRMPGSFEADCNARDGTGWAPAGTSITSIWSPARATNGVAEDMCLCYRPLGTTARGL